MTEPESLHDIARQETARIYGAFYPPRPAPPQREARQAKPKRTPTAAPEPATPAWAAHLTRTRDRLAARRKTPT